MRAGRSTIPPEIRPAGDLLPDGLGPLAERARAEGIGIVARVVERWRDGTEVYGRPGESLLVAVVEPGRAVAIGGMTVCPTVAGALRVRRFYVDPEWRRGGLARAVAIRLLDDAAAHTSTITCNAGASDAAVPFWESMGFEPFDGPGITHRLELAPPRVG